MDNIYENKLPEGIVFEKNISGNSGNLVRKSLNSIQESNDDNTYLSDNEDKPFLESNMEEDDTDELTELFSYLNHVIFLLENDIYLPILMRASNVKHEYVNVYVLYTPTVETEPIYENLPEPHYENTDVHEFRRNMRRSSSDGYEPVENFQNFRRKNLLQKVIDFFAGAKQKLAPLTKIVFRNETGRSTASYISVYQDDVIYENIPAFSSLQVLTNANRSLPAPPLPDRNLINQTADSEESIYEEIGFQNHIESLYEFHNIEFRGNISPTNNRTRQRNYNSSYIAGGSDMTYDSVRWSERRPRKSLRAILGFIWTIVCAVIYITDVGSDIVLAFRYWSNGENLYCGLTLSLVYIASTVDLIFSIYRKEFSGKRCIYKFRFILMFILNIRGVFEYLYLLQLELKDLKIHYLDRAMKRNLQLQKARVATLNSYEGIFEACPQIVLQLYLILMTLHRDFETMFVFQIVSVSSSLCTSGAAFVAMEKGVRLEDYGIHDLSIVGIIVQYLWLSPITASRLLSVALLLSVAPQWFWLGAVLHLTLGATLYWFYCSVPASLRKLVHACVYGARVLLSPYEPEFVRFVVPALNVLHALQNAAATAAWVVAVARHVPVDVVISVCAANLAAYVLGLFFAVLFHKCKSHFYRLRSIEVVDYGYDVIQII